MDNDRWCFGYEECVQVIMDDENNDTRHDAQRLPKLSFFSVACCGMVQFVYKCRCRRLFSVVVVQQ